MKSPSECGLSLIKLGVERGCAAPSGADAGRALIEKLRPRRSGSHRFFWQLYARVPTADFPSARLVKLAVWPPRSTHPMPQTNLLLSGRNFDLAGWKLLYQTAILEIDSTRLPKRIAEARRAILDRAEEIQTNPTSDERSALNNALRTLRILDEVAARERSPAA